MILDTKYLKIKNDVKLNTTLISVIEGMEPEFERAKLEAWVTSGIRTSEDQLNTIIAYVKRYKVDAEFPEVLKCGVTDTIDFGHTKIYTWQRAWSKLLNIGVIINPPRPAKCLFDYYRNGINKKGVMINYSPHFYEKAFDIGGGLDHDITNELEIAKICLDKRVPGMKGYLAERKNNCVHIDCY